VQQLLSIRRDEIVPRLAGATFGKADAAKDGVLTATWQMGDGAILGLLANLSDREISNPVGFTGTRVWGSEFHDRLQPWSVHWRIGY
jgi:maltooligosyltrehalose trehalohydrolase